MDTNTFPISTEDLAMLQQLQNGQQGQYNVPAPSSEDLASLQPPALYQQPQIDPRTQQMDQAMLDQVSVPPAATQPPSQQDLAAISPSGQQGQNMPGDIPLDANGQPLQLPPNTGAANLYGGQQPVSQDPAGNSNSKESDPPPGFWNFFRAATGLPKGTMVPNSKVIEFQKMYGESLLKAKSIPLSRMIMANGHQWVQQGNTLLPADPKPVATQQIDLGNGTIGRYVTDPTSPDYLKAQPVYDASTGQPVISNTGKGNFGDIANYGARQDLSKQIGDLTTKIAAGQKPWWGPSYEEQLKGVQAQLQVLSNGSGGTQDSASVSSPPINAIGQNPQPSPASSQLDPYTIKALYKFGKISKSDAVAMLNNGSGNSSSPVPTVSGPDDYAKIPAGAQFVFNGKVLTKGQKQKSN